MLNQHLTALGLKEEWRSIFYAERPRKKHDVTVYIQTDPYLYDLLSNQTAPDTEVWRAILRINREIKNIRMNEALKRSAFQRDPDLDFPRKSRPRYAFDINGRKYLSKPTKELDVVIKRVIAPDVNISNNKMRINNFSLPKLALEALPGEAISKVIDLKGVDAEDYAGCKIDKVYHQGRNIVIAIEGYKSLTPSLNSEFIEPFLRDEDDKAKRVMNR